MNVVYFGYRKWAYTILKRLIDKNHPLWQIQAVITNDSPEASFEKLSLPCLSFPPHAFREQATYNVVAKYKPSVLLFYGWSWLIPEPVLQKYLCLVLHTSPLPKYRGGSPLQHQIIRGETESAITILKATKRIDGGDIYAQSSFLLTGSLSQIFQRIVKVGTEQTVTTLDGIAQKTIIPAPQNEKHATFFKRRKPEDSEITLEDLKTKTSEELYNFIRALEDPYPNAYIRCKDGKKLFFKKARAEA